jgi:hypothetical protein
MASNTKAVAMRSGGRPSKSYLVPTPRAEFDSGGHRGRTDTLHSFVKMWPTPGANDAEKRGNIDATNPRNGLPGAVKLFPTPSAGDNRDRGCMKMPAIQRRAALGKQLNLSMVVDPDSGALNADWVEWLMGFPTGWTVVNGWKNQEASRAPSKARKTAPTD